jgi:hypothetical protein
MRQGLGNVPSMRTAIQLEDASRQSPRMTGFLRLTGGVSLVHYWRVSSVTAFPPAAELGVADEPVTRERVSNSASDD